MTFRTSTMEGEVQRRAVPLPPGEGRGVKGPAQTDLAQGASAFVLDPRGDGVPLPTGGSSSILGSANSTHGEAWQGRRRSACRVAPSSAWQATRARAALPCLAKPRSARRCVILAVRGWGNPVGLATARTSLRCGTGFAAPTTAAGIVTRMGRDSLLARRSLALRA